MTAVFLPLGVIFLIDYLDGFCVFAQASQFFRTGFRGAYQVSFDLAAIGLALLLVRRYLRLRGMFWPTAIKTRFAKMEDFVEGKYGILFLSLIGVAGVLASTGVLFLPRNAQLVPGEDHTFITVIARTMLNHASLLYNHDLGFPVGADHYYFPLTNYWVFLTVWVGTVITNNVFGAVQFFYIMTIPLIFLSCFLSLSWLRIERFSAFMMAWAYCLLPFAVYRFSLHDTYTAYYAVPMAAALALHLERVKPLGSIKQTVFHNVVTPFTLIAIVAVAWSDVYYAFFAAFFIGIAGFLISVGNRKIEPLAVAAAQIVIISMVFGLCLLPYWGHSETFPVRGPDDQYAAAIRIPDFIRLFPNVPWLAMKYNAYTHSIRPVSEGADFWPGKVLSFIVLLSPLLVMAAAARQKDKPLLNSRFQVIGLAALLISAAVLFGLPESYGYLFNMLVTGTIRSQNRAGVFVAFFALVILHSIFCWLKTRMPKYRYALVFILAVLLLVNVWPTLGYAWKINHGAEKNENLQADITSIRVSLTALHDAHAQNVLQLPIAGFPEVPNIGQFMPCNHFLFYIYDKSQSPMRWSYGMDWHQPEYAVLKNLGTALEAAPDKKAWTPFRCLGFDAVVIEKAAYDSATIRKIEISLKRLGITNPLFEDEKRAVFTLATLRCDSTVCPESVAEILAEK